MAKLQYVYNGQAFEIVVLPQGIRVGSAPDAGLSLATPQMAPYHFTIFQRGGVFSIQDMSTPSGTFVNGQRLANHPGPLPFGATIQAGGIQFNFLGDQAQPAPPQVASAPPQAAVQTPQKPKAPAKPRNAPAANRPASAPQRAAQQPNRNQGSAPRGRAPQTPRAPQGGRTPTPAPASQAGVAKGPPQLHFLTEEGAPSQSYDITTKMTIGRDEENDLAFEDGMISGFHCTVENRNGKVILTDHDSSNGTWVNTEKLQGARELKYGDIVTVALIARFAFGDPNALLARRAAKGQQMPQMKRHVGVRARGVPMAPAPKWGVAMTIAIVIFLAAAAGGFFLPKVMFPAPKAAEVEPSDWKDKAYSFEGGGSYGGWTSQASADGVKLGLDKRQRLDGDSALVATVPANAKLTLTSSAPLPLGLNPEGTMTLHMRGSAGVNAKVSVAILNEGQRAILGQQSLQAISTQTWSAVEVNLKAPQPIEDAQVVLEFSGQFPALWVDRIRVKGFGDGSSGGPIDEPQSGGEIEFSNGTGNESIIENAGSGAKARILPSVLNAQRQTVTGEWSQNANSEGLGASWSVQGGALPLTVSREEVVAKEIFPSLLGSPTGSGIKWSVSNGGIALTIQFDCAGESLSLFDSFYNEIPVNSIPDAGIGPVYALGTNSLLLVIPTGDVGVKFTDFEKGGVATITLAQLSSPMPNSLEVLAFSGAPLKVLTWQSVATEMDANYKKGAFSAANERAILIKNLPGDHFAALREHAEAVLGDIAKQRERLLTRLDRLMISAKSDEATIQTVDFAQTVCQEIIGGFKGDKDAVAKADKALSELEDLRNRLAYVSTLKGSGLRPSRPIEPSSEENKARAIANAARVLEAAKSAFDEGNWLLAHLFAENVAWNYSFTPSGEPAAELADKIESKWREVTEELRFSNPLIRRAQSEIYLGGSREKIEQILRKVIARYPKGSGAKTARILLAQVAGN